MHNLQTQITPAERANVVVEAESLCRITLHDLAELVSAQEEARSAFARFTNLFARMAGRATLSEPRSRGDQTDAAVVSNYFSGVWNVQVAGLPAKEVQQ
jgi:hypothetical protein